MLMMICIGIFQFQVASGFRGSPIKGWIFRLLREAEYEMGVMRLYVCMQHHMYSFLYA